MAPYRVGLIPEERRHTLKFRPGGEAIVHALALSVRNHDVALPGLTADGMEADLSLANKLKPVGDAAEAFYQFADDTIWEASSECWYAATVYYTTLSRMVTSLANLPATAGSNHKGNPRTEMGVAWCYGNGAQSQPERSSRIDRQASLGRTAPLENSGAGCHPHKVFRPGRSAACDQHL